ncbi:MAG: hypothetical protein EOO82_00030 [Oxalobacteraceae bacterium]|nr:MAG: hypothetical protein EOO82_00030 [Oxalobacteraceae bacterium]
MSEPLHPTIVYESYWAFASERLAMYYRKLTDPTGPWTDDEILQTYRFTNTFRAADRVSQYLIREVQYRQDRSQAPAEVFFRTMLFKIFNRIDTWESIERTIGNVSWQSSDLDKISALLSRMIESGERIYSAAYIMPSPSFGRVRKHENHLALLARMMEDNVPAQLTLAKTMKSAYELILSYPGLGPFLAFQYTIDLNYSSLIDFDENDFVVAGPGALDGISKCFRNSNKLDPTSIIYEMVERQNEEFGRLGLEFSGLFGRMLKPIDCQNLFCEISKYARAAHPEELGLSGRTRIKQRYRQDSAASSKPPTFPPKWGLRNDIPRITKFVASKPRQLGLSFA